MRDLRLESSIARRAIRAGGMPWAAATALVLATLACTETFDAGHTRQHGQLPVDERNPILLMNDGWSDNWQGEYAVLLSNGGGPRLCGIIVGTGSNARSMADNLAGWQKMVTAARASGLQVPDPIASEVDKLQPPASGNVDDTQGSISPGAHLIVSKSNEVSLPYRPLVVVTGGRLTDVANAYLLNPAVTERVFVVSSLGSVSPTGGGLMGVPNGEMDSWADKVVAAKFRYVQVSVSYDQYNQDVPSARLGDVPEGKFGDWIRSKQAGIGNDPLAADQVAVAAVGIPSFALDVKRVSVAASVDAGTTPAVLDLNPNGPLWLVRDVAPAEASARFWKLLLDPKTFGR